MPRSGRKEKKMEEKKIEAQKLGNEEMKAVAGGDILDDIACGFDMHSYEQYETFGCFAPDGTQIDYIRFRCKHCGNNKYESYNYKTHKREKISKSTFEEKWASGINK